MLLKAFGERGAHRALARRSEQSPGIILILVGCFRLAALAPYGVAMSDRLSLGRGQFALVDTRYLTPGSYAEQNAEALTLSADPSEASRGLRFLDSARSQICLRLAPSKMIPCRRRAPKSDDGQPSSGRSDQPCGKRSLGPPRWSGGGIACGTPIRAVIGVEAYAFYSVPAHETCDSPDQLRIRLAGNRSPVIDLDSIPSTTELFRHLFLRYYHYTGRGFSHSSQRIFFPAAVRNSSGRHGESTGAAAGCVHN